MLAAHLFAGYVSVRSKNMKTFIIQILILSLIILSACSTADTETCYSRDDRSFTKAVSLKLNTLNFPYTTKDSYKLCFKQRKRKRNEFIKITHQVEKYYRSIAVVLKDKENKDAVFSWLKESGTPYYTHENDRGTFISIHSLTEELAIDNKIKLDEILHQYKTSKK